MRRKIAVKQLQAAGKQIIALEYKVLDVKLDGEGKEVHTPVDPRTHTFSLDDTCRIEVKAVFDCFLYVINEDPTGRRTVILPSEGSVKNAAPIKVAKGDVVRLPADDEVFFFQPPVGEEKLAVVATKQPAENLEGLVTKAFENKGQVITSKRAGGKYRKLPVKGDVDTLENLDTLYDGPDPEDGSSFALTVDPDGPEMVVNIPLRSKN
jgi:hypothetical protein